VIRDLEIDHADSCLVVLWQGAGPELAETASWLLLSAALRTAFFHVLRTEKQLGYTVAAAYDRHDEVAGLRCSIQSPVAGPVRLLAEVDDFMQRFRDTLASMPTDRFETIRAGVLAKLRKVDDTLYERTTRLARDLDLGVRTFDRRARVAAAIESLQQDALVHFHTARILEGGRLIIRSTGEAHSEQRPAPEHTSHETAIAEFGADFIRHW
jgi:secreted Zn-dependent insulinase-like peptidase